MFYQRPPKPDVFEVMLFAKQHVFVRVQDGEYLIISNLRQDVSVSRWCRGDNEPATIQYTGEDARALGLFDGDAWDIQKLARWVAGHCVVCWKPLTGKQKLYDSHKCQQKAWRQRNK